MGTKSGKRKNKKEEAKSIADCQRRNCENSMNFHDGLLDAAR